MIIFIARENLQFTTERPRLGTITIITVTIHMLRCFQVTRLWAFDGRMMLEIIVAFTIKTATTVVTNDDFKGDSTADMLLFAITID